MSDGTSYADIIILALIAGFILLRLRSVLGDKVGNDKPSYFNKPVVIDVKPEQVVTLDEKSLKPRLRDEPDQYMLSVSDSSIIDAVAAIKAKDASFTATHFLNGAKGAFEMVFDAFSKGDKATLKMLMSDSLYQEFASAITDHEAQEERAETTLVSVQAKEITQASLTGSTARLTVHFTSEQVRISRSKAGEIVGGDASHIHPTEDHWVFEREITSKNPNWKIIET